MQDWQTIPCPIQRTATLLTDRYVIMILRDLASGPKRFTELQTAGINPRTLVARLRHMEAVGFVIRNPEAGYALGERGTALLPLIGFLRAYGETWLPLSDPGARETDDP